MVDPEDFHYQFKIVVMGENKVGKTTFLEAITQNFGKTIENLEVSDLHIKSSLFIDEMYAYKFVYYDINGRPTNLKYATQYCSGATAAIIIFDATKRNSFEKAELWIAEVEKAGIPIKLLIGNKIDQANEQKKNYSEQITKMEALALAGKYRMEYFEVCSIGEASIMQVFDHLLSSIFELLPAVPDMEGLMHKGIILGKRITQNPKFRLALAEQIIQNKELDIGADHPPPANLYDE